MAFYDLDKNQRQQVVSILRKQIVFDLTKELVVSALEEIIDVHDRYKNFSFHTQHEAQEYIQQGYYSVKQER